MPAAGIDNVIGDEGMTPDVGGCVGLGETAWTMVIPHLNVVTDLTNPYRQGT